MSIQSDPITLDNSGQFVTVSGKRLGITATLKGKRWQFRDSSSGVLYASGMSPAGFVKSFWFRDDFVATV